MILDENISAYAFQETWLEGKNKYHINGFHLFTHGLKKPKCSRGQVGIAILLSPTLHAVYVNAGSPLPLHPRDPESIAYSHIIAVQFPIHVIKNIKGAFKKKRERSDTQLKQVCIILAYSPVEHTNQVEFNKELTNFLNSITRNQITQFLVSLVNPSFAR